MIVLCQGYVQQCNQCLFSSKFHQLTYRHTNSKDDEDDDDNDGDDNKI